MRIRSPLPQGASSPELVHSGRFASIQGTKAPALAHHPDEQWLVAAFVPTMAPAPPGFRRTSHDYPAVRSNEAPCVRFPAPCVPSNAASRTFRSVLLAARSYSAAVPGCRSPWLRSTTSATAELPALVFDVELMVTSVEGVIPQASLQVDTVPRVPGHVPCLRRHPAPASYRTLGRRTSGRWLWHESLSGSRT